MYLQRNLHISVAAADLDFIFSLLSAMSKISAVWLDSTLRCNNSVICFPHHVRALFPQCLEMFSAQQFSHQFFYCLVFLYCAVPVALTAGFSVPSVSSQPSFNKPFQHFPFAIAFLSIWLNTLGVFLFFSPLYHSLFINLLRGVLSSEKHFFRRSSLSTFSQFTDPPGNNSAIRHCHHFFCQIFVSQGTCYVFWWHPFSMFYTRLQASPGQHSLD